MACAPKLDWLEDRIVHLPRHLKFDTLNELGKVCEWRPRSGIALHIFEQLGLDYCAVDGLDIFDSYKPELAEPWTLVFGAARHRGELEDFRAYLQKSLYEIVVMTTPSEVEDEIWFADGFWSQRWRCDSAQFGDVLAGTWNVYVRSKKEYSNLDFSVPGRMLNSLRRCFGEHGLKFLGNPHGVPLVRPIENSIGKTIIIRRANGEERLSPDTHIPPYSRKTAEYEEVAWPVLEQAYRQPKTREKLLALGAHHAWVTSETEGKDQLLALWKTYPVELLRTLLFEVFQAEVDSFKTQIPQTARRPIWQRDNTRVGGFEKLDSIVDSSTGYKKLNALMSGMSIGTCKSYMRGWKHWVQYCALRGLEPWVNVEGIGWGETILDFIMFENAVLGLKPSTTAGKICAVRYFHVIHGRSDFTTAGVRYKLLLKSLSKKMPGVQKLPYNMDLLDWVYQNLVRKSPLTPRIKETWAGLTLGFFFLLRASEIRQLRQKDIEVGLENGRRKLTIFIYQSKTDQSQRGCFRTLVETGNAVCPVRSMIGYLNSFDWNCESDEKLFDDYIEKRLRTIIKWSAASNGLMSRKFSTHSLRSGGATAMYVRGISVEHIRRFGRWASDTFRRYLYHDNQVFRFIGSSMVMATGLLDQLQMTQPEPKTVSFDVMDASDQDDEDQFRVGGGTKGAALGNKQKERNPWDGWKTDSDVEEEYENGHSVIPDASNALPGCRLESLPSVPSDSGEDRLLPMSLSEAAVHGNVPPSTLMFGGMLAVRTRSPGPSRYSSDANPNRIHTSGSDDEKEIAETRPHTSIPRSSRPVSATTMVCTREARLTDDGGNAFGMDMFSPDSESSPSMRSDVSMTSVDEYPDTPMSKASRAQKLENDSASVKTKLEKTEQEVKSEGRKRVKKSEKKEEMFSCKEEKVKVEHSEGCSDDIRCKSNKEERKDCDDLRMPTERRTCARATTFLTDEERVRQIDELCDGMKRLEREKDAWCRVGRVQKQGLNSPTSSVITRTANETATYTPPGGHAIQSTKRREKRRRPHLVDVEEPEEEPVKRQKYEVSVGGPASTPRGGWGQNWKALGQPYFGNDVKVGQKGGQSQEVSDYPEVIDSQDKIIALLEMRLEAEKREKERLENESRRKRSPPRETTPVGNLLGESSMYAAGSFQGQRNIGSSVSQVMNIYHGVTNMQQTAMAKPSYDILDDMPGPSSRTSDDRRNSWFKADNFHLGGNAPSGRNTPEYWNGAWEGMTPTIGEVSGAPPRSAFAKHSRAQKRKDKEEVIRAMDAGEEVELQWKCTDTPAKLCMRNDAQTLLDILRNHKSEYGREPEKAVSEGALECAKLGSKFLELASAGDHYSVKKYLRREMMKYRKEHNDQEYQGHLMEYEELHKSYLAAWTEVFG